ncbi:hypothetical protein OTU49_005957 [Cherax quadricarinatus]|uniref:Uncharacterized protein n=1 Tax=Cherax quadricarinatus TaxID=27406 RepID=A0AAW0WR61_CHEQU
MLVSLVVVVLGVGACECGLERGSRYTWGDALTDPEALGPDGSPYPNALVNRLYSDGEFGPPKNSRRGRTLQHTLDPQITRTRLLAKYHDANSNQPTPEGRSMSGSPAADNIVRMAATVKSSVSATTTTVSSSSSSSTAQSSCPSGPPARLCQTRFNTTAPMYGISLTSGQPVTIVQKFPDLLQQVIFEVCESKTCDVVQGTCVQTYVPYLFLVIPLGPVTLTGQDYVLVESGCVCQPKYSQAASIPSPLDAIPGLE